jgi:hypothetical protein
MTKEQIEQFLDSPEATAALTLLAYGIEKTPTQTDDQVLAVIADYTDLIAKKIEEIAAQKPTDQDAKKAAIIILEKIASLTATKWDDFAVGILKKFI